MVLGLGSPSRRLEIPIGDVVGALFFSAGTGLLRGGHRNLLFLQYLESLVLMPAVSIQRDV